MFKLIKITGARTNVPEPITLDIDGVIPYTAGNLYYLGDDALSNTPYTEYDMKFIPLETVAPNSGKTKLCGYFVNENMIFEADIYNDFSNIKVGNILSGHIDSNGDIDGANSSSGSEVMLIAKNEARSRRKILVALKW